MQDAPNGRQATRPERERHTMTKFEKTMKKAETLQSIYNAIKRDMEWYVCWEDQEALKPIDDEDERFKYEVYQEVFKALEKMI